VTLIIFTRRSSPENRCSQTFESHHVRAGIALGIALLIFAAVLYDASMHIGNMEGPRLRELELASSP
jgi:hypothetical protein